MNVSRKSIAKMKAVGEGAGRFQHSASLQQTICFKKRLNKDKLDMHMPLREYARVWIMKLVRIYRCLCDETRLRILHLLKQGPLCVCHFQEILQLQQVAVSKHLAYLRKTGLVEARRHEQWMIYSLPASPGRELDLQLRCLQDCVQTEPIFREDLRRLKTLGPECNWISGALNARSGSKKHTKTTCPGGGLRERKGCVRHDS